LKIYKIYPDTFSVNDVVVSDTHHFAGNVETIKPRINAKFLPGNDQRIICFSIF